MFDLLFLLKITPSENMQIIFTILGGLGIFLIGIKFMGDGLKLLAGDRLKTLIDKYTTNPFKGALVGMLVTVLIQSSSGTTALTISLVRAGLMSLPQAIGVIMGANIGTTVTSILIGLKVGAFALPILALGSFMLMFGKKKKTIYMGQIFFGFGALFYGLGVMGAPLKELSKEAWFSDMMLNLSKNPFAALLVGTVFTFIVQSSSATIGIVQQLYSTGSLPLNAAIPMVLGDNIGTTITAILAAIGGSIAAKRAATAHVLFNVIGSLLFMILLVPFTSLIVYISAELGLNPEMQIALTHALFNISMTLILIWFVDQIADVTKIIIKGDDGSATSRENTLNKQLIDQSPALAIEQAKATTHKMGLIVEKMLVDTTKFLKTKDFKAFEEVGQSEVLLNTLEKKIKEYLIIITNHDLSEEDAEQIRTLMQTTKDYERMGDHLENINEFISILNEKKLVLTDAEYKDIRYIYKQVHKCVETVNVAFKDNVVSSANTVLSMESEIDDTYDEIRNNHIERIESKETKNPHIIATYVDVISDLERISDHCANIAKYILGKRKTSKKIDYSLLENITG